MLWQHNAMMVFRTFDFRICKINDKLCICAFRCAAPATRCCTVHAYTCHCNVALHSFVLPKQRYQREWVVSYCGAQVAINNRVWVALHMHHIQTKVILHFVHKIHCDLLRERFLSRWIRAFSVWMCKYIFKSGKCSGVIAMFRIYGDVLKLCLR